MLLFLCIGVSLRDSKDYIIEWGIHSTWTFHTVLMVEYCAAGVWICPYMSLIS